MSFLGGIQFANASVPNCDSVFHSNGNNPDTPQLKRSPEFQNALTNYLHATMTQKNQLLTPEEKRDLFSKLAKIAQEQKLTKEEFSSFIERERDIFVHTQILAVKPGDQIIEVNSQKVHDLEQSRYALKFPWMPDFHSPADFLVDLEKNEQYSMQAPMKTRMIMKDTMTSSVSHREIMESIIELDEYRILIQHLNNDQHSFYITAYVFPHQHNPNLRQLIFDYSFDNKTNIHLWVLQEKIRTTTATSKVEFDSWKTLASQKLQYLPANFYLYLFPFYSPDQNKIILAPFFDRMMAPFQWIILDSPVSPKIIAKLPHLRIRDQMNLERKLSEYFSTEASELLGLSYSEELNSFYFVNFMLPENFGNRIEFSISRISIKDDQDINFSSEFHIEDIKDRFYTTHFSFAKDGGFIKISHHSVANRNQFQIQFTSSSFLKIQNHYYSHQPAPPPGEDGPFRQTKYFFPVNSLQVKSSKSRSE